jgi:hypothetical protein
MLACFWKGCISVLSNLSLEMLGCRVDFFLMGLDQLSHHTLVVRNLIRRLHTFKACADWEAIRLINI